MKKYQIFLSENFPFLVFKFSIYLNRRVFAMSNDFIKGWQSSHAHRCRHIPRRHIFTGRSLHTEENTVAYISVDLRGNLSQSLCVLHSLCLSSVFHVICNTAAVLVCNLYDVCK